MIDTLFGIPIVESDALPEGADVVIGSPQTVIAHVKWRPPIEQEDGSFLFRCTLVDGPEPSPDLLEMRSRS